MNKLPLTFKDPQLNRKIKEEFTQSLTNISPIPTLFSLAIAIIGIIGYNVSNVPLHSLLIFLGVAICFTLSFIFVKLIKLKKSLRLIIYSILGFIIIFLLVAIALITDDNTANNEHEREQSILIGLILGQISMLLSGKHLNWCISATLILGIDSIVFALAMRSGYILNVMCFGITFIILAIHYNQTYYENSFINHYFQKNKETKAWKLISKNAFLDPFIILNNDYSIDYGNKSFSQKYRIKNDDQAKEMLERIGKAIVNKEEGLSADLESVAMPKQQSQNYLSKVWDIIFSKNRAKRNKIAAEKEKEAEGKQDIMSEVVTFTSVEFTFNHNTYRVDVSAATFKKEHKNSLLLILKDRTQDILVERLQASDQYKDLLLATVSHDLRNPLSSIMMSIGSVIDQAPKEMSEILLMAKESGEFMLFMINDLLDFSQIQNHKLKINSENTELQPILDSVEILIQSKMRDGVQFKSQVDDDVPLTINTDPNRLKQVLINLLTNAMKYTTTGHVFLKVCLNEDNTDYLQFEIEDTGTGISEEDQKKLFQPYGTVGQQKDKIHNPGGIGLGLMICKEIVTLLTPKKEFGLKVCSQVDKGSTFSFSIPYKDVDDAIKDFKVRISSTSRKLTTLSQSINRFNDSKRNTLIKMYEENIEQPTTILNDEEIRIPDIGEENSENINIPLFQETFKSFSKLSPSMSPMSSIMTFKKLFNQRDTIQTQTTASNPLSSTKQVETIQTLSQAKYSKIKYKFLLVDDDHFNILSMKLLLNPIGHSCKSAYHGLEGLNILNSENFDFDYILLDLNMPVMNGIQTCQQIRKQMKKKGISRQIYIVGLTGHYTAEQKEQCQEAGMDLLLNKPLSIQKINEILQL